MSTTPGVVMRLFEIEKSLYEYGCPILMILGTISCLLNLIIFTKKTLRKNPCSIYLISYNLSNFIYIYTTLLPLTFAVGYEIDLTSSNLILCRLRLYTNILFNILSPFYLILASIDRILVTSPNALTRQKTNKFLALILILSGTLFWSLFHIHALLNSVIIQSTINYSYCSFHPGLHLLILGYYSIFKEITILSLMILCGLWSIKNIRQSTRRIRAIPHISLNGNTQTNSIHLKFSKDRQLILMLLVDISLYTGFSLIFTIFLILQQITQDYIRTVERTQIGNSVRNLCLFSISIPFCISSYTNLIVSKTFRSELKKIFSF